MVEYLKFRDMNIKSPNALYTQQMERIKKEIPMVVKNYGAIYNKKRNLNNELKGQQAKLRSMAAEITQKEQLFQKSSVPIFATAKGKLREWVVRESQALAQLPAHPTSR